MSTADIGAIAAVGASIGALLNGAASVRLSRRVERVDHQVRPRNSALNDIGEEITTGELVEGLAGDVRALARTQLRHIQTPHPPAHTRR